MAQRRFVLTLIGKNDEAANITLAQRQENGGLGYRNVRGVVGGKSAALFADDDGAHKPTRIPGCRHINVDEP